ncbi:MAG: transposase [Abitibacteriaceae bacterium]|nr:transposase [Abditibacteriaceae bacterium]
MDQAALAGWCCPGKSGRRGASLTYSESAIVCALTLQSVYHLPLRAT